MMQSQLFANIEEMAQIRTKVKAKQRKAAKWASQRSPDDRLSERELEGWLDTFCAWFVLGKPKDKKRDPILQFLDEIVVPKWFHFDERSCWQIHKYLAFNLCMVKIQGDTP